VDQQRQVNLREKLKSVLRNPLVRWKSNYSAILSPYAIPPVWHARPADSTPGSTEQMHQLIPNAPYESTAEEHHPILRCTTQTGKERFCADLDCCASVLD
jgi:hypothetical protein